MFFCFSTHRCHSGWSGTFCDQCVRYPGCLHGSCQRPWECLCDEGWGGLFCNQDLNYCTNHKPCRNGGTCFNTGHGVYTCACAPGFTGTDCETPLLDCQAQPCLNQGTCLPSGASNASVAGSTAIEAFASASDNSEVSIARKYRCACAAGWKGRHCEVSSRSCRDAPCARNATCEDDSQRGFRCHCPAGYTGADCEQQIDECAPSPCANGATCTDLVNGFKCTCPAGFTGERCQTNIDDCASNPCLNGATCRDKVDRFSCHCVPGYVGDICQHKVDICPGKPCANGGTCIALTNDFQCSCMPGFTGKDCSVELNECESSPCQHGGTCRNRVNGFVCDCTDGWRGDTCAESTRPDHWLVRDRPVKAIPAAQEAEKAELDRQSIVFIATVSTLVPACLFVAFLAIMRVKRRQKREQAKADEEARLQNERNAVHSSMTKRATAMLSGPLDSVAVGDAHMIKNTWSAQQRSSCSQIAGSERSCSSTSGKSVNNDNIYESSLHDGSSYSKAESGVISVVPDVVCRQQQLQQRSTKQLNTEAAAHRASQHLYQKQDKDSCLMESKRVSSMYPTPENSCCSAVCVSELKRPNTSIAEAPPDEVIHTHDSGGCGVYVIDDHYVAQQLATQV